MAFKKNLLSVNTVLVTVVGLLAAVTLALYLINSPYFKTSKIFDSATYQAVFLDNNQIYFGHLKSVGSVYLVLSDVYYVQVQTATSKDSTETPTGRLVKLGQTEPHGPKDEMILNKEHILFWENLMPSSQIIKTIQNLKTYK